MPKDCRETALNYLEHRERSSCEVRLHLLSKGFQEEEIEEELQSLKELRYIDDARYCSDYIRYGAGKGRGPVRLQAELAEKGVEAGLIQEALTERFDRQTEKEAAMKEAVKLLAGREPDGRPDEKILAKIGRRLNSLGYHADVIYDVIRKLKKA
jgi:regulatory protein